MYLLSELRRRCRSTLGPLACCSSVELLGCTSDELEKHLGRPHASRVVQHNIAFVDRRILPNNELKSLIVASENQ